MAARVKVDFGANLIKHSSPLTALASGWFQEEASCGAILTADPPPNLSRMSDRDFQNYTSEQFGF
jgi:hypothetical protein